MTKPNILSAADVAAKNVFLLGSNEAKGKTCERIIDSWDVANNGALVVFDHSGHLYEDFGQGQLLTDFCSDESVRLDCISPILLHKRHGRSPVATAELLRAAVAPEKAERGCNDQFWNSSGSTTVTNWFEYALAIAKQKNASRQSADPTDREHSDVMLSVAECSGYLTKLMTLVTENKFRAGTSDDETEEGDAGNNISDSDDNRDIVMHYLGEYYGPTQTPFAETLKNNGNNGGLATCLSTLKTAKANGRYFLRLMDLLSWNLDGIRPLPVLGINDYVKNPHGKRLYVCSTGDNEADRALAALALFALAAAAETEEKNVTLLIPEIDKWDVLRQLTDLPMFFRRSPKLIFGYSDLQTAQRSMALDDAAFFAETDNIADMTIWHESNDVVLNKLFAKRIYDKDAIYSPCDLGDGLVAEEERGNSVKYLHVESPTPRGSKCTRNPLKSASGSVNWFYQNANEDMADIRKQLKYQERKELLVANGMPRAFVDKVLSAGLLTDGHIGKNSVNDAYIQYLAMTLRTQFVKGRINQNEIKNIFDSIIDRGFEVIIQRKHLSDGDVFSCDFDDPDWEKREQSLKKLKQTVKAGKHDGK